MPDSVRETIVKRVITALNAPVVKPATATRSRAAAYGGSELPAFVVYPVEETPERASPNVSLRKLRLRVEAIVQGEPPVDDDLDPLLTYAVQTLFADVDVWSGGLVRGLNELQLGWSMEPGAVDVGMAYIDFEIAFTSKVTDPTLGGL